ncbi:MAG: hypothetical protein ACTHQQ_03260, partial [Solirubrobacteraceae bacterium]
MSCPAPVEAPGAAAGAAELEHAHHEPVRPQAPRHEHLNVPTADPLALDPYSPILPTRPPQSD